MRKYIPTYISIKQKIYKIGPSGVRALPLGIGAEQSVHYFCDYFCKALSQSYIEGLALVPIPPTPTT